MHTGGAAGADATGAVAHTNVLHDAAHASYVTIPVQPEPGPMVLPPLPV
jgi:hypothetical protein